MARFTRVVVVDVAHHVTLYWENDVVPTSGGKQWCQSRLTGLAPFSHHTARRPNPSIHHTNSAIELILGPLGPRPLRAPQPSVSLLIVIIIRLRSSHRVPLPALSKRSAPKAPPLSPQK
jgi:hypothetical protein